MNNPGNGQDGAQEPQSTGSILGQVFGIGPLFKMLSDPAMQSSALGMMQAMMEGARANARIEAKLDALLGAMGHDVETINARFRSTAIFTIDGSVGVGGFAPSSLAPDNGVGGASQGAPETIDATPVSGGRVGAPGVRSSDGGDRQ